MQVIGNLSTAGGNLEIDGASVIVGPAALGDSGTLQTSDGRSYSILSSDNNSRTIMVSVLITKAITNAQALVDANAHITAATTF